MISFKNEWAFIRDLTDHTLPIILDAWWASMNGCLKRPIAWNNSRHVCSWRFDLHCGIEENGSPGITYTICYRVLRHLSDHGTGSIRNHSLPEAYIGMLNKLTESEACEWTSTTNDETALAILKWQVLEVPSSSDSGSVKPRVITTLVKSFSGGLASHASIGQAWGLADSLKAYCYSSWFDDAATAR
jgi:hypothetical protein